MKLATSRVILRCPAACDGQLAGCNHNAIIQPNMEDSTFHIDYDDSEHSEFGRINNSVAFELFEVFLYGAYVTNINGILALTLVFVMYQSPNSLDEDS
ncbi:hypothetical protein EVAR_90363_1 [Eumeta japonica]|uniref:Uncharacterized protein n=1 Tax=Eumeta variegata TaxID=151549 RepID=A0A4C1YAW8_EUMVA|nr:hypothetical protein EVAR_90363_1 [Eumeta japonica]